MTNKQRYERPAIKRLETHMPNKIMRSGKLELTGLHCHIGTFMLSSSACRR